MASPEWNAAVCLKEAPLHLTRWTIDHESRLATSQHAHRVPLRPFLGCIGLADPSMTNGWTPGPCGGNMDCRELTAGSRLMLPVAAPGAMLSVGDTHAAQGDGEVAGTAIECGLEEARLKLTLIRGRRVTRPRVRTTDGWLTLGFGPTLDEAAGAAMSEMLDLMMSELTVSRVEAMALASAQVSLRITQVVNPARGVHAFWPMG